MKLIKGTKAAKNFMAKLRAAKGKGKRKAAKGRKTIGAAGDYAKFELSTIKFLAKLLKKPLKDTQKVVNTSSKLLDIISDSFNAKKTPAATAKILKEELKEKLKHNPTNAFIQLLSKLPKKEVTSGSPKFPMKLPAVVTIGSIKTNAIEELKHIQQKINYTNDMIKRNTGAIKQANETGKKIFRENTTMLKKHLRRYKKAVTELKKLI